MIKSLEIHNFQSHKKSVIELDKNVTAIIGLNNHGKSAVLKALRKAIRNEPNGNVFIRNIPDIAKNTELIVTTNKGNIKRVVGRGSAAEDNIYEVNTIKGEKFEYTKFSKTGIPKEVVDVSDISLSQMFGNEEYDLNFQKQRDDVFLVTGKGLSSIRSKVLSKITGVDKAQRAIQVGKLKERNFEQSIKKSRKDRETYTKDLERYERLDETSYKIESIQQSLEHLKTVEDDIEYYKESFESLTNILQKARNLRNISKTLDISFNVNYIKKVKSKLDLLKKISNISIKEGILLDKKEILSKKIETGRIIKILNQINILKDIEFVENKINSLNNISSIEIISLAKITAVRDKLEILQKYLNMYNNIIDVYASKENDLIEIVLDYEKSVKELNNFKTELGICPLCKGSGRLI